MTGPRLSIIPARAATDRALKPRDLQVLCVLGRHTDDLGWCRKSQVKMADEMGCARSTVFEAIERLVKAGYLERYEQEEENGRDSPHVYRVILDPKHANPGSIREADSEPDYPCRQAGTPAGISAPPAGPEPAPPAGPEPAPKNDPLRTTHQNDSERERERDDQEKPEGLTKRAEGLFYKSFVPWDRFAVSPKQPMLEAWGKLTWSQMQAAADAVPRYLAAKKMAGMRHAPAISTYLDLNERLWEAFPPEPEKARPAYAPAFGPVWAAIRMRDLVTGPKAEPSPLKGWEERAIAEGKLDRASLEKGNLMRTGWPMVNALHFAAETRGLGVHDFGPVEEALGKLCEFVPVDSDCWKAWKAEHDLRGWPWLPDPGTMRGVYFPVGGPGGLEAFEQALRGNHDAGGREAAE